MPSITGLRRSDDKEGTMPVEDAKKELYQKK